MKHLKFWSVVLVAAAGLVFTATGSAVSPEITYTLNVNTTNDVASECQLSEVHPTTTTGTCSLRGAIWLANDIESGTMVINLPAGYYSLDNGTLLTQADQGITQIKGAGAGSTTIDGWDNSQPSSVFDIEAPTQISGVTITGGTGNGSDYGDGGGIWQNASLDLQDVVVTGNTACSSWSGGACVGSYGYGGGIYDSSNYASRNCQCGGVTDVLTLDGVTVSNNTADEGAGIFNDNADDATALIDSSTITGNTACDTFSNGICVGGGSGGGIYNNAEIVTIESSTVSNNSAGSPAYDSGDGGGIYNTDDTTFVSSTKVTGNTAGDQGGGIYDDQSIGIADSTISNNTAGDGGGGITEDYIGHISHTTVKNNTAGGTFACFVDGGDTYCEQATDATVGDCPTLYPGNTYCSSEQGQGGGVKVDDEYVTMTATNVTGNTAVSTGEFAVCGGGVGGGIYNSYTFTASGGSKVNNNSADCGGGIYNESEATFALSRVTMTQNSAFDDGGGIWTTGYGSATLLRTQITANTAGDVAAGIWDNRLGSVLFGRATTSTHNVAANHHCQNVLHPCK